MFHCCYGYRIYSTGIRHKIPQSPSLKSFRIHQTQFYAKPDMSCATEHIEALILAFLQENVVQ